MHAAVENCCWWRVSALSSNRLAAFFNVFASHCLVSPQEACFQPTDRLAASSSTRYLGIQTSLLSTTIYGLYRITGGIMSNLEQVLRQLRDERGRAEQQLQQLQSAIAALEGVEGGSTSRGRSGKGRVVSILARQRMAEAQRARWARARQGSAGTKSTAKPASKRQLSAGARRRIAAAQRARWAKFRAERQKKAA